MEDEDFARMFLTNLTKHDGLVDDPVTDANRNVLCHRHENARRFLGTADDSDVIPLTKDTWSKETHNLIVIGMYPGSTRLSQMDLQAATDFADRAYRVVSLVKNADTEQYAIFVRDIYGEPNPNENNLFVCGFDDYDQAVLGNIHPQDPTPMLLYVMRGRTRDIRHETELTVKNNALLSLQAELQEQRALPRSLRTEISNYVSQIEFLTTENSTLQNQISDLRSELETQRWQSKQRQAYVEEMQKKLENCENVIVEFQQRFQQMHPELSDVDDGTKPKRPLRTTNRKATRREPY